MYYKTRHYEDVRIVDIDEDISVDNIEEFKSTLKDIISIDKKIICNFKMVSHMNSQSLGILSDSIKELRDIGGDIKLSNLSQNLILLFKTRHLEESIDIYDTEEEAIQSFMH